MELNAWYQDQTAYDIFSISYWTPITNSGGVPQTNKQANRHYNLKWVKTQEIVNRSARYLVKTSLRRRRAFLVSDGACSHKIDYVTIFLGDSESWKASKSHYRFKSYSDFAEWVIFACWWSCIGKGLRSRLVHEKNAVAIPLLYLCYSPRTVSRSLPRGRKWGLWSSSSKGVARGGQGVARGGQGWPGSSQGNTDVKCASQEIYLLSEYLK